MPAPGDTCATCRFEDAPEKDAPGVAAVDEVASKLREMPPLERVHAPLYLGNWPGKEEEEQQQGR